ncbi:MAG: PepSY domain-containing protein [Pseudolabrys sp.]|nr:PepSY domain-containing protein [Pseudolabrys sp.]
MNKIVLFATLSVVLGAAASTAQAGSLGRPCTAAPASQWLTIDALQAKVEAQGYKVRKAKLKKACGELYTIDKTGARVELFVDPTDGKIVGRL